MEVMKLSFNCIQTWIKRQLTGEKPKIPAAMSTCIILPNDKYNREADLLFKASYVM